MTPVEFWSQVIGSSPLTRGTRLSEDKGMSEPAVHPRLRGELSMARPDVCRHAGSSPLTRGTPPDARLQRPEYRFIPAYAGNSRPSVPTTVSPAVHPRLRGELCRKRSDSSSKSGSSPLTRGTPMSFSIQKFIERFIPAYAGNSLKQGIEHLTNSSKDFLSGKYAKNPETVLNHFKNSSLD